MAPCPIVIPFTGKQSVFTVALLSPLGGFLLLSPHSSVTPFPWRAVALPPPPFLPWPPPPLSPPNLVQRVPLWPREVPSVLASGGPPFPTALCSGEHAPSLARVAIGCPGHVHPAPPPWELVSQPCSSTGVLCSVRALPKSARESRRCRKPPWSLEPDPVPQGRCSHLCGSILGIRLGIPRKRLLSGSFWGSSHILKAAPGEGIRCGKPQAPLWSCSLRRQWSGAILVFAPGTQVWLHLPLHDTAPLNAGQAFTAVGFDI